MEEQAKISNVSHSDGKITVTIELTTTPFWNRQIKLNDHPTVLKRALKDALDHDVYHGPYICLVPEFAKLTVPGLDSQFREHNPAPEMEIPVAGLSKFIQELHASEGEDNEQTR